MQNVTAISTLVETELPMKQLWWALSTSSRARVSFAPASSVMWGRSVTWRHPHLAINQAQPTLGNVRVIDDGNSVLGGEEQVGERLTRRQGGNKELLWIDPRGIAAISWR
jgi:hypothetical protein